VGAEGHNISMPPWLHVTFRKRDAQDANSVTIR
jgi:hypothetical protein